MSPYQLHTYPTHNTVDFMEFSQKMLYAMVLMLLIAVQVGSSIQFMALELHHTSDAINVMGL